MTDDQLETPATWDSVYEALTEEDVSMMEHRPLFTGDVLRPNDTGVDVCLVQHPCAMRRGNELVEKVLACTLTSEPIQMRSDWSKGDFKKGFLPALRDGNHYGVDFTDLVVFDREELKSMQRVAVLSALGVNHLVQRWIYHNSRVVVRTITIHDQIAPQHEEADLTMEFVDQLVDSGVLPTDALAQVDRWFDDPAEPGGVLRYRLLNPQKRPVVRKRMRVLLKEFVGTLDASDS